MLILELSVSHGKTIWENTNRTAANIARLTDKKCPFVGEVSIRGRILTGTVVSTKMHRTLIIRREYLHFVQIGRAHV